MAVGHNFEREEDLNVKIYDGQMTSDGKISNGLWPGELK